jgi:hypothetical protein
VRLAFALPLALALGGCTRPRTEAFVSIDVYGLTVGMELDELSIALSDDGPGEPTPGLFTAQAPLCAAGQSGTCYDLPVSLTVLPGPSQPHDVVRLDVDALLGGVMVLADAVRFSFVDGTREDIHVVLYARCLNSDCASLGETCGPDGKCVSLLGDMAEPADAGVAPDLAVADAARPPDLTGADLAGADLRVAPPDLSPTPDLGSCCAPCINNTHCCVTTCICQLVCGPPAG